MTERGTSEVHPRSDATDAPEAAVWDAFVAAGQRRRYPAGSALFLAGDPPGAVFAVLDGTVEIRAGSDDGEVLLTTVGPGQLLGEIAALDGLPRSASAVAATDVDAATLPAGRFNELLEAQPALALRLLRAVATRLRAATDDRVTHRRGDAMTRVAAALVALAEDRGAAVGGLTRVSVDADELVRSTGGDHEMLSRALTGLAGEGWIERGPDGIDLVNLAGLGRLAADAGVASV